MIEINPFAKAKEKKIEILSVEIFFREIVDNEPMKRKIKVFDVEGADVFVYPDLPKALNLYYDEILTK